VDAEGHDDQAELDQDVGDPHGHPAHPLSLAPPLRLPAVEAFTSLLEARVLVEDWRIGYNTVRPHNAPWLPDPNRRQGLGHHPPQTLITGGPTTGAVSITVGEGPRMSAATGHDHS
jgi:hypothetical protein